MNLTAKGDTARGISFEGDSTLAVGGETSIKVTGTTGETMGIYSNSTKGGTFQKTTIDVTGDTGRTYGINVRTASNGDPATPVLSFGVTTITVKNGAGNKEYLEGVHVDYSNIEFASLDLSVTDNATANEKDVRGVTLQGDTGLDKAGAEFKGDSSITVTSKAREVYGVIASSGTSTSITSASTALTMRMK